MKHSNSLYHAAVGIMGVWLLQGCSTVHAGNGLEVPPGSTGQPPAYYASESQSEGSRTPPTPTQIQHGAAEAPQRMAQAPQPAAQAPQGNAQPEAADAQGDVAKLTQLILHDSRLFELRTTYNGSYGASLFFYEPEMAWYVALFQNQHFWRVVRSQYEDNAETIYTQFVHQTAELAKAEIRVSQLKAEQAAIQRRTQLADERARRLQADMAVAQAQQAEVNNRQRDLSSQTAALQTEKQRAEAQLRDSEARVRLLERSMDADLPVVHPLSRKRGN